MDQSSPHLKHGRLIGPKDVVAQKMWGRNQESTTQLELVSPREAQTLMRLKPMKRSRNLRILKFP